jgi:hypothetical protein
VNKAVLTVLISFLFASPLHAVPLTWVLSGTTTSASQFNGMGIGGLDYELRIFLDTDIVGNKPPNLGDVQFIGPHQAEVEIETLGILPTNMIPWVENFDNNGQVTAITLRLPAFNTVQFASSISNDPLHLTPIPPTAAASGGISGGSPLLGPNGLILIGPVTTFSAVLSATSVPEPSLGLLLGPMLLALACLRRRS